MIPYKSSISRASANKTWYAYVAGILWLLHLEGDNFEAYPVQVVWMEN